MKILTWIHNARNRRRLAQQLRANRIPDWELVKEVWRGADQVNRGPIGFGATITVERAAVEAIARRDPRAEGLFSVA